MDIKLLAIAGIMITVLIGCHGDDSVELQTFEDSGLYQSNDLIMLIDGTKPPFNHPFILKEFNSQNVWVADAVVDTDAHGIRTKSLTYINNGEFSHEPQSTITVSFYQGNVIIFADFNQFNRGLNIQNLSKIKDTLPLFDIVGNHINSNGYNLKIENDGSFFENESNSCVIEGNLTRNDFYFNVKAKVSNCTGEYTTANNDNYKGVLMTANINGKKQIESIIINNNHILTDTFPNN
ncbi:hypothetical protein [Vibrio coralliilyticus]|uniref:hypothetical protein n=1 Tax=Vibrio coralliilyticus TaxID=190893 RepID=UPI0017FBA662|nr:hypothetical protein [Vibrio coralliilyticus]NUW68003.1 hypothetical protein [Vibrio coralliilyticus]